MAHIVIDVLNPENTEEETPKKVDVKEEPPKRTHRFVRKQVINIGGEIVEAP